MEASFSISSIFQSIWGYTPANFEIIKQPSATSIGINYYGEERNVYGRSYYMPVWLDGKLLQNPVIKISSKKTIVQTALVNRTGSVKELISTDDYLINIKGLIVSEDSTFPEEQITQLRDIYLQNEAITIENALISIFFQDNENVVITDFSLPEVKAGVSNVRAYEMNLVSDKSFKLIKS